MFTKTLVKTRINIVCLAEVKLLASKRAIVSPVPYCLILRLGDNGAKFNDVVLEIQVSVLRLLVLGCLVGV